MLVRLAARSRSALPVLGILLGLCACAAPEPEKGPRKPEPIIPADMEGLPKAVLIGKVVIADQPTPAQLADLAHEGFATVINLRPNNEMTFDESVLLHATRVHYVSIPFTPTTLDDRDVNRFLSEIRVSLDKDEKVFIHCSSGNRAAALWAIYEITDLHVPPEQAVARARQAGLKSPELIAFIGDYSRRIGVEVGAPPSPARRE